MIPIHVGIMSHFRSIVEKYIPLKTVTTRPNDKPWMDSEVRLAIRRRDRLPRIHNIRPFPVTWESSRAQRNFVTSLMRFAKKTHSIKVLIRIGVIEISTVRSGGLSLIGYVVKKILHLFHSLFKETKCLFLIPRRKRTFLTSILC